MTISREQLVRLTLEDVGVLSAGQTANAEDAAYVDQRLPAMMDDLAFREIWTWGDPDQIDEAASLHLAALLAGICHKLGGLPPMPEDERLMIESRLRQLDHSVYAGGPQTVEYF